VPAKDIGRTEGIEEMMRRFSRKRRGEGAKRSSEVIDASRWLARIEETSAIPVSKLEVISDESVSDRLAVVGRGLGESGEAVIVAFSPTNAGDALLAGLATGVRLSTDEAFTGEVFAIAPSWSIVARRRLGLVRVELPFKLRPISAPELAANRGDVEAEADLEPTAVRLDTVGRHLSDAEEREIFQRATRSLEGLAAKHGGAVRGVGRSVELIVYAQRMAELRADEGAAALHIFSGQRQSTNLSNETLAGAFDDLEGQIRRRLNDKKLRGSEEALRANTLNPLIEASGLRAVSRWPTGASDRDAIDVVGLGIDGRPVAGAGRKILDLAALGTILDSVQKLRLAMPVIFADASAPVRFETPELLLAAKEFGAAALQVLSALAMGHSLYEIRAGRDQKVSLEAVGAEEAVRSMRDGPPRRRRQGGRSSRGGEEEKGAPPEAAPSDSPVSETQTERGGSRRRGRRGGRGGERSQEGEAKAKQPPERPGFEEVSLFDLDDSEGKEESPGPRRRGRQRQRGRRRSEGRRDGKPDSQNGSGDGGQAEEGRPSAKPLPPSGDLAEDQEIFSDDLTDVLSEIPDDLPALQPGPSLDYTSDDLEEGGDDDGDRNRQRERDKRRAVRKADVADVPVAVDPPRPPRRRAVIVSAGDRDSLLSAVLLARDVRLLEGVWIYKQSELMNFFREVMPDIQEGVPIHLVGFVPSPAADVLQAAALYRDRLTWYDHHTWPPEDLFALKQAIGEDAVHHVAGAGSTLPLVLATSSRRSRFSDKMVDLACGRFTEHDYERWGRLWWSRLGELAGKSGGIRSDIEPLLAGRPSDLAKEAARAQVPEAPGEVAYVAGRDFRIVHFAGYALVIVNASEGIDLHLASRIARERYEAQLSLAYAEASNLLIFGGEETGGRRTLDFGALAEHLAEKLDWVQALPDDDHVARFLVDELDVHPERLDEVVGEIAMGRSILER
jgi:hypothetical protein